MGRPNNRGGGVQSSSSSSLPHHGSSVYDPANLRRSLLRNDVEFAALSKLHRSMRVLRDAIIDEYGDAALVERASSSSSSSGMGGRVRVGSSLAAKNESLSSSSSGDDDRLGRLSSALFLRAELRRRLLSRLARRLHRVAHAMDGGGGGSQSSSSPPVSAPPPPLYGDVVRRYVTTDAEESGLAARILGGTMEDVKVVRERDVLDHAEREGVRAGILEALDGRRRGRTEEGSSGGATGGGGGGPTEEEEDEGGMTESKDAGDGNEEDSELIVGDDGGTPEKGATAATATEEGKSNGTERPSEEPLSEVDALLRADEEDKALLDRLAEYDPGNGYDKVYHIGPSAPPPPLPSATVAVDAAASAKGGPDAAAAAAEGRVVVKVTVPIASTIDDHEVNDEGEFLAAATTASNKDAPPMQRLPFSLHGSSAPMARTLLPKERAAEWKRWTKAICDRIPDQVTFEELGVGVVFEPERRLMNNKRKGQGGDGEGGERHAKDAAAYNRGKGKVLRKNAGAEDADDDAAGGDAAMGEAEDETKAMAEDAKGVGGSNKKAEEKENQGSTTKTFSVTPVPSFYNQDLQRIRNIQSEMVRSLQVQQSRERVIRAQVEYDAAYKRSIDVQQAKAAAVQEYAALPEKFKEEEAAILNVRNVHLANAKRHWEMRHNRLKVMGQTFGEEQALNISVCNDVLQNLKDRVCIRVSEELKGSGLGTHRLYLEASKARSKGDESRDVSATVLGHMIDSVDRRHQDILQDNAEFFPPVLPSPDNVIASLETGETMAQRRARTEREMRAKIAQFDVEFKDAERKRSETWLKLRKAKGDGGSSGVQSASTGGGIANKAKPRSRKSVPAPAGGGGGAVAPSGQPYPMQMQTQPGPGYVPASYYQPQRPPAAATQMQAQMVAPAAAQMMMQQAQISRMQTMMVQQQQQQQYQTHAIFPVQSHPVQNIAVSQMIASQMPQPGGIVSAGPSLISVTADPSFVSSAPSIFASTIANETVIVQDTAPPPLDVQKQHTSEAKQSKYGYGDRYSQTNVNARKNADGTVVPASTPKLLPDGTYARPAGRQRKGMDWDAIKGCWYPVPGGGGSSYSGSGNEEG